GQCLPPYQRPAPADHNGSAQCTSTSCCPSCLNPTSIIARRAHDSQAPHSTRSVGPPPPVGTNTKQHGDGSVDPQKWHVTYIPCAGSSMVPCSPLTPELVRSSAAASHQSLLYTLLCCRPQSLGTSVTKVSQNLP